MSKVTKQDTLRSIIHERKIDDQSTVYAMLPHSKKVLSVCLSDQLVNNTKFLTEIIKLDPENFKFLPPQPRSNIDLIRMVAQKHLVYLQYANFDTNFDSIDDSYIKEFIKMGFFKHLPKSVKNDRKCLEYGVSRSPGNIEYIDLSILSLSDLTHIVLKHPRSYRYLEKCLTDDYTDHRLGVSAYAHICVSLIEHTAITHGTSTIEDIICHTPDPVLDKVKCFLKKNYVWLGKSDTLLADLFENNICDFFCVSKILYSIKFHVLTMVEFHEHLELLPPHLKDLTNFSARFIDTLWCRNLEYFWTYLPNEQFKNQDVILEACLVSVKFATWYFLHIDKDFELNNRNFLLLLIKRIVSHKYEDVAFKITFPEYWENEGFITKEEILKIMEPYPHFFILHVDHTYDPPENAEYKVFGNVIVGYKNYFLKGAKKYISAKNLPPNIHLSIVKYSFDKNFLFELIRMDQKFALLPLMPNHFLSEASEITPLVYATQLYSEKDQKFILQKTFDHIRKDPKNINILWFLIKNDIIDSTKISCNVENIQNLVLYGSPKGGNKCIKLLSGALGLTGALVNYGRDEKPYAKYQQIISLIYELLLPLIKNKKVLLSASRCHWDINFKNCSHIWRVEFFTTYISSKYQLLSEQKNIDKIAHNFDRKRAKSYSNLAPKISFSRRFFIREDLKTLLAKPFYQKDYLPLIGEKIDLYSICHPSIQRCIMSLLYCYSSFLLPVPKLCIGQIISFLDLENILLGNNK